ncbi:hypothetical protein FE840_002340 [Peteryoungia desertarenae]|uniref:Uncharacterized protein n=1 Tax=Peteryoungia desertarenae TaxID=1813451 RepID=A0ABX6QIT2_9HYPH|nr:hypothetical protein [Peteryoungia desertarenae]QLF68479.1 hypothetical protein FE840_002340 [Peteryoungia desertarenae]
MIPSIEAHSADRRHRDRSDERMLMRQLFLITYPLCLASAVASRTMSLFSPHAAKHDQSVFAEARSAAYAAVGYAFHA